MADNQSLQQELADLRKEINYHNYLYNTLDQPSISDFEYDQLFNRLKEIEAQHPELITPDSPTQRVGSKLSEKFAKVQHPALILSLANGFGPEATMDWYERIAKIDPRVKTAKFVLEPKLDGLTVVVHYHNGLLSLAATRGDGIIGEDITENIRTISSLPLRIPVSGNQKAPDNIVFRGEVIITKADFQKLNQEIEAQGQKPYLNPRNTAAGSLRQLDPRITASRPLRLYLYQIVTSSDPLPASQSETLDYMAKLGLPVNPLRWHANSIQEVLQICEKEGLERHSWPYDADGVVIKIDDRQLAESLGVVGKDPRSALAYKYPGEEVETILEGIQVNVGRTGVLTPLALLEPVNIGGVVVKQATLHNFDFIAEKDIRIGDHVLLKRAGEVIPYIIATLPNKRDGSQTPYLPPAVCPSCGAPVEKDEGMVAWYCINSACPAQLSRNIEHFASRTAMDISGLGEKIVQQLVDNHLITSASDLYHLKEEDLLKLDKFGSKKAQNLLEMIQASKTQSLARLITALGIRGVGEVAAEKLKDSYGDLDNLAQASQEALKEIDGIGEVVANDIHAWFGEVDNQKLLDNFKAVGLWPLNESTPASSGELPLSGLSFVITGTLPNLSREQAEALIKQNGGKVVGSVSKKTDFLLLGENPGSKYNKALELGVQVISQEDLYKMVRL